jgi:hypothetical protein
VWDLVLQALADSGGNLDMLQIIDSTIARAHRCAVGKKGFKVQLSVVRGAGQSKIHLGCNAVGLPIDVVVSEGQAHDSSGASERFDHGFNPAKSNPASDADITPPAGYFIVARLDGQPAGCGALKRVDATTGVIKRM